MVWVYWDDPNPWVPVLTRMQWGALPPRPGIPALQTPVTLIHLARPEPAIGAYGESMGAVQRIQKYFMDEKGLPDIPYSFMIVSNGDIYEGRGLQGQAHGKPDTCLHIILLGDLNNNLATLTMENSRESLLQMLVKTKHVHSQHHVVNLTQKGLIQDSQTPELLH